MFHQGLFQREIKGGRFSQDSSLFMACILPVDGIGFFHFSSAMEMAYHAIREEDFIGLFLFDYFDFIRQYPWGYVISAFRDVHTNIWIVCRVFPKYQARIQELFCGMSCGFPGARDGDFSKVIMGCVHITSALVYPEEMTQLCQFRPLSHFSNPENLQVVDNFSFRGGK